MKRTFGLILSLLASAALSGVPVAPSWGQTPRDGSQAVEELINRAKELTEQGKHQQAIETLQQAFESARNLQDRQKEATALLGLGVNYSETGQPQKALEYYNRALPIFQEAGNRAKEATTLNNLGLLYKNIGEPQTAQEYYERALPIFQEVDDRFGEAATLNNLGTVYQGVGQPQTVLKYYERALTIFQAVDDRFGEAATLDNLGSFYDRIGKPQTALEYFTRALLIFQELENRIGEADTLNNLGLLYDRTGKPQIALEYFTRALLIFQELENRIGEATTLNNLGLFYDRIGKSQTALESYARALAIHRAIGNRDGEATTLTNLGLLYDRTGKPQTALEYFTRALLIFQELENRSGEATTLNNLGSLYDYLGQFQTALEYYEQALPILQEVGNRTGEATALNNLGGVYDNIGQTQKALEYYEKALPIFREAGNRTGEANLQSNLGLLYKRIGEFQTALEYYTRALFIAREVGYRTGEAAILHNLGGVYDRIGQTQKALEYYEKALPIFREVGNRTGEATVFQGIGLIYHNIGHFYTAIEYYARALSIDREVGDRTGEASTLGNLGALYQDIGQYQKAIEHLEKSLEITLEQRQDLQREYRQEFLRTARGRVIALVDLLIDQNQPKRAYEWLNRVATADLADYSRLIDAKVQNPEAQKALDEWNEKNQQLEFLRQQLQGNFSEERTRQMRRLEADVYREAEEIGNRFPEVAELFETQPTDLAQLQQNLPVGTVLIQPILLSNIKNVPNTVAVFILTRDTFDVTKTDINPNEFDQLLNNYLAQLQDPKNSKHLTTSQQLYNLLIRPVAPEIDTLAPQRLAIIATGKLRDLPFETLHDGQQYLIEKYPIHYLTRLASRPQPQNRWQNWINASQSSIPTGAILLVLGGAGIWGIRQANRLPLRLSIGLGVLAVGGIVVATASPSSTILGLGNPVPDPPFALKNAEAEVTEIAAALPGSQSYLGNAATLETFKTQSPRFPIIHLATHGCFQPEGCCLRDEDCAGTPDMDANTLLFANREQYNIADAALLGLNDTELIALSACQTARNAKSDGQNLPGLAYIFERAGAKTVMASLWNVEDAATKDLMVQFYSNLKLGKSKAEAMRQAKLSQIQRHPFFWSPFVLIGDGR